MSLNEATHAERRSLVALSMVPGLGPRKIRLLLHAFGTAEVTFSKSSDVLRQISGIGRATANAILGFSRFSEVDRQFTEASRLKARFVSIGDVEYPELLKNIYDPPPFLWVKGKEGIKWDRTIAVVGTRKPTAYGQRITRAIVADLSRSGLTVVSGLAYGIDAIAHQESLKQNGCTVAVLGSGLDQIYPKRHAGLAGKICESGCLISSFPFGTKPEGPNFPQRNRIISGASMATVVTEAYGKGGALITARYALDQNRDVFAVPGETYSEASVGTNRLIKEGVAKLVQSSTDIFDEINPSVLTARVDTSLFRSLAPDLTGDEKTIYDTLDLTPLHLDTISRQSNLATATVSYCLLKMELAGYVHKETGNHFARR